MSDAEQMVCIIEIRANDGSWFVATDDNGAPLVTSDPVEADKMTQSMRQRGFKVRCSCTWE